ncbi:hypothetical protein I546_5653 [Mycobacterium kansasii 732]|nr:hypothetical protein I546_5653 [Mycobacterium kansasii 732]
MPGREMTQYWLVGLKPDGADDIYRKPTAAGYELSRWRRPKR